MTTGAQNDSEHNRRIDLDHGGSAVAELLHNTRVRIGEDLQEISQILCIRYPYLQAIEAGRFQDLPGPTYASGFVRAYAEHLGLDGPEVVRRFKAEAEGLGRNVRLAFPLPTSDGRVPTGGVVLAGVILAGLAYGAWVWMGPVGQTPEIIAAVPDRLAAAIPPGSGVPPAGGTGQPATGPGATGPAGTTGLAGVGAAPGMGSGIADAQPASGAAIAPPSPTDRTPTGAPITTDAPTTGTPTTGTSPTTGGARPPETTTTAAAPVLSVPGGANGPAPDPVPPMSFQPAPAATASGAEGPAPTAAMGAGPGAESALPAANAEAASPPPAGTTPAETGRVFGAENADARIVLRATADTFVHVRDKDKDVVAPRILRKGEVVRVPNKSGLTLLTGNAGGLEIVVDGHSTPSLGPSGKVRRVTLDPDKLKRPPARRTPPPAKPAAARPAPSPSTAASSPPAGSGAPSE